jgi:hypothetical protein
VAPESVRMLLTGYSDVDSAISAVNEGQIFRFISKPCPPDQLVSAFRAATAQHDLIVAERVLLEKTLLGCVESLARVLSIAKPAAFGRALRLRSKVRTVLEYLMLQSQWQIEAAAVLSQLGAVTLSEDLLIKLNEGEPLEPSESADVVASLQTSIQMLENVPRMEPVVDILGYLALEAGGMLPADSTAAPPGALLLRLVFEWDRLEALGCTQRESFEKLAGSPELYGGQEMLDMLKQMPSVAGPKSGARATLVQQLVPGMVLAEDLVRANGVVILPRGFEIDRSLLDHVMTFAGDLKADTIKVFSP